MSVPNSLIRVPVEMPDRSGHDMSHSNSFTGTTGTLIPVMCEELLPNDTISLGSQFQVQFPPMVTDFYGRVDFVLEAFFVPSRLLWQGWQDFMTHPTANPRYPEGTPVQARPTRVPFIYFANEAGTAYDIPKGSLLHYLDYGTRVNSGDSPNISVLPALAYHRIWNDWYRDTRVQAPLFYPANTSVTPFTIGSDENAVSAVLVNPAQLPYLSCLSDGVTYCVNVGRTEVSFPDGVKFNELRQRNWVKDYFTAAAPLPQAGGASEVKFDVSSSNEGALSIAALRAANSLQKWMERNNLAGYRYSDQIYAQFGIYPSDAIMDRVLYLGRNVQPVYTRSVFETSGENLGKKGANSQVLGEGSIIEKFTASEHGYLMVLASLVPRPIYGTGAERRNFRTRVGEFAFPLLAGMGDQEIKSFELTGDSNNSTTFGYTDLYAEYKFRNDKVHGLLVDGQNLDTYILQRSFDPDSPPELGSDFLTIPVDYLDQVQAVSTATSGYSYWAQIYWPFKKISTIPAYSQPTLADLKHAHTEYISRGGKRL